MASVKQGIAALLKRVNPDMEARDLTAIISHLMGPNIGVKEMSDLPAVTVDMLPASVTLSRITVAKLLKAFQNVAGEAEIEDAGPSRNPPSAALQSVNVWERRAENLEFHFEVPWNDLPKETLRDKLQSYKEKNQKAPWSLLKELKLAIVIKLVDAWMAYRQGHPEVSRKNPGRVVYRSIGTQVYNKYGAATDIVINEMFVARGDGLFVRKLEEAVENRIKKLLPCSTPQKSTRTKGTVGVLLDAYNPGVRPQDKESLLSVRDHLKMISTENPTYHDWPAILEDMAQTYPLQRDDVVAAVEAVREDEKTKATGNRGRADDDDQDEEDLVDDGELEETQMSILIKNWPFLFSYAGLNQHAKKLTGRDLVERYRRFEEDHAEYMIMYLITSTKVNLTNLIIKHKVEKLARAGNSVNFLMILQMLINHFQEDINSLILTCERTTDIDLLPYTLLKDRDGSPCIVALDDNMYQAEKYLVCGDKTVLITVKTPDEALIALMNACFVFDFKYPELPQLFEFIERFIFKMALIDSKVLKKGKQIGVVTEPMRRFNDSYEELRAIIVERMREN